MSKENKSYNFNHAEGVVVTKTGETKGNVAKWFETSKHKSEAIEGDIIEFTYEGSKGSMPTSIFYKNFIVHEKDFLDEILEK